MPPPHHPYPPPPRERGPKQYIWDVWVHNLPASDVSEDQLRDFLHLDRSVSVRTEYPQSGPHAHVRRIVLGFPNSDSAGYVVTNYNFKTINGHVLHLEASREWETRVGGTVRITQQKPVSLKEIYRHFSLSAPVITVFEDSRTPTSRKYMILFNTPEDARKAVQDNGKHGKHIFPHSDTLHIKHKENPGRTLFRPPPQQQAIPIAVPGGSSRQPSRDIRDVGSNPASFGPPSIRHAPLSHTGVARTSGIPGVRPSIPTIPSITASTSIIPPPRATAGPIHHRSGFSGMNGGGYSSGNPQGRDAAAHVAHVPTVTYGGRHKSTQPAPPTSSSHYRQQQHSMLEHLVFECNPASKVLEPVMDNDSLPYQTQRYTELFCAGSTLPRRGGGHNDRAQWCKGAFLSYESLHNLSSASKEGDVTVSSLTWGSQLDISTITLNYGSEYRQQGQSRNDPTMPLVSSLSVTMDRYGDRDSANELLATYQNEELPTCSSALNETANIKHPGRVLQMKCLESGHLVTVTTEAMHVWDSELQTNQSIPLITLGEKHRRYTQIDTQRSTLFAATPEGHLSSWDLTQAVSVADYEMSEQDVMRMRAPLPRMDTCRISIHPHRDQLLVGSPAHGRVAIWDTRSAVESLIVTTHMTVEASRGAYRRDPVFDCEWNPQKEYEFMTAHAQMIRIWDARKVNASVDQVKIKSGMHNILYRARWSPHHGNLIAGLCTDGRLRIWCTDTSSMLGNRKEDDSTSKHELLFLHCGHQLAISDFSWCPYVEDTIASVAPSTKNQTGEIQVWRPRNLLDDLDNMDP